MLFISAKMKQNTQNKADPVNYLNVRICVVFFRLYFTADGVFVKAMASVYGLGPASNIFLRPSMPDMASTFFLQSLTSTVFSCTERILQRHIPESLSLYAVCMHACRMIPSHVVGRLSRVKHSQIT